MTDADRHIRLFVSFNPLGTSPNTENAQAALARGICHLVIDRLPDASLPEMLEWLKTMVEFYSAPRQQAIAPPAVRRSLPVKVTGRQERRPLSFLDE